MEEPVYRRARKVESRAGRMVILAGARGSLRPGFEVGRRRLKVGGDFVEPIAERASHFGKYLSESGPEFFFSGRGDAGNDFARLMIEVGDRGQHPLIGDVFQTMAVLLGSLIRELRKK